MSDGMHRRTPSLGNAGAGGNLGHRPPLVLPCTTSSSPLGQQEPGGLSRSLHSFTRESDGGGEGLISRGGGGVKKVADLTGSGVQEIGDQDLQGSRGSLTGEEGAFFHQGAPVVLALYNL